MQKLQTKWPTCHHSLTHSNQNPSEFDQESSESIQKSNELAREARQFGQNLFSSNSNRNSLQFSQNSFRSGSQNEFRGGFGGLSDGSILPILLRSVLPESGPIVRNVPAIVTSFGNIFP